MVTSPVASMCLTWQRIWSNVNSVVNGPVTIPVTLLSTWLCCRVVRRTSYNQAYQLVDVLFKLSTDVDVSMFCTFCLRPLFSLWILQADT